MEIIAAPLSRPLRTRNRRRRLHTWQEIDSLFIFELLLRPHCFSCLILSFYFLLTILSLTLSFITLCLPSENMTTGLISEKQNQHVPFSLWMCRLFSQPNGIIQSPRRWLSPTKQFYYIHHNKLWQLPLNEHINSRVSSIGRFLSLFFDKIIICLDSSKLIC